MHSLWYRVSRNGYGPHPCLKVYIPSEPETSGILPMNDAIMRKVESLTPSPTVAMRFVVRLRLDSDADAPVA